MPDGGHSLNRHQRRRRAAQQRRSSAPRYSIQDFHDDAAGVFSIGVLTPIDIAPLMLNNTGIAASLIDWLTRIEEAKPLCASCDFVFTREVPPTMWLVAQAVGNLAARGVMLIGGVRGLPREAPEHRGADRRDSGSTEAWRMGRSARARSRVFRTGRSSMIAAGERAKAAERRAEDLGIAVDLILRSVPAIDDPMRLLDSAGGSARLVRALKAELAARRGRR